MAPNEAAAGIGPCQRLRRMLLSPLPLGFVPLPSLLASLTARAPLFTSEVPYPRNAVDAAAEPG